MRAQKYSQGLYSSQLLPSREPQRGREGRGSRALVHPSAVCDQVKDAVLQVEKLGPGERTDGKRVRSLASHSGGQLSGTYWSFCCAFKALS